jgi:hypothetical protein
MAKQSAVDSLKESIRLLEIRQAEEGQALKEHFKLTLESFNPINLLKSAVSELTGGSEMKNTLFDTIISVVTGFITKKIMIRSGGNPIMRVVGALLQFGVTTLVAKNVESIRNFISSLIEKYFPPSEEEVPETEVE